MTTPQGSSSYKANEDSSSIMKWLIPLLVALALIVAALFIFGVFDADIDADPGSVDIEAPEIDADVDVDVPDVDIDAPDVDVDVDPGDVDVEDPDADAEADVDN